MNFAGIDYPNLGENDRVEHILNGKPVWVRADAKISQWQWVGVSTFGVQTFFYGPAVAPEDIRP